MPLHPAYDLAALRAEAKKLVEKTQQRRDFMHKLPADAKEAIATHCEAINLEDKALDALNQKIKAKEAEIKALETQPAEEAQPTQ